MVFLTLPPHFEVKLSVNNCKISGIVCVSYGVRLASPDLLETEVDYDEEAAESLFELFQEMECSIE